MSDSGKIECFKEVFYMGSPLRDRLSRPFALGAATATVDEAGGGESVAERPLPRPRLHETDPEQPVGAEPLASGHF